MNIVLASASPRRKELLEMLEVENLIVIPAKGEEIPPEHAGPGELVMALSAAKAREVAAQRSPEDLVIGADTIVWFNGRAYGKPHSREEAIGHAYGKPHSREEAIRMLEELSGNTHRVYTGVTVIVGGREDREYEESQVTFRQLSREEIERYVDTGEPMDKAGAYGAQGKGALLVEGIRGDFFNVMGLPLCRLALMLRKQGVEIL